MKNLYNVTVSCIHHYGNNHMERHDEPPIIMLAKNGDEAVTKVKAMHKSFEPQLEKLERVVEHVRE